MFPCSQKYGIRSAGICYSCKFEMAIFKIVQVMTENIRFAFHYVLSICMKYGVWNTEYITR